jgi:LuxR family transcriptional regulator, maltose regulon positive regulatory protein
MDTRSSAALIRTKLYRPRVTDGLVPLLRVRQTLDHHLDRPLTLVCAPAGFGKTTLLSDWLANCPRPSAWLSLDAQDNDPAVFLAYMIAAVRKLFPDACATTLALLQAAELPPLRILSATLVNDMDSIADGGELPEGQRFLLVLDDYYLIHNLDVHQLLDDLLLHPPRSLHLVLGTRHDPPLALATQRAHGQLVEIRMAMLRFNGDETAAFVQHAVHFPLDQHTIAVLEKRSEGWVAALRFAALAFNMRGGDQSVPETLLDNRFVMDYLLSEVLARLPMATQEFLLRTAILKRLNGPLCDALTGQGDSTWDGQRHLEWLEQENAFTIALDDHGQWYRYHHLLQKLLLDQLERRCSVQEIADLHGRASAWYAANGYVEDAIAYALEAGDEMAAAHLVEMHRHALMNHEQWQSLERWLQLLPRRLIEERAPLLMAEAWLLQSRWRIADTLALLERVEVIMQQASLPEPDRTYLRSEVDTLRSHIAFHHSDMTSQLTYAERALKHVPMTYSSVRGHAWMDYAVAQYLLGNTQGWRDTVHEALNEDRLHGNAFPTRVLQGHCFLTWMDADLAGLQQGAAYLLKLAGERGLELGEAWGHYFMGSAAYQANDLDSAQREFEAVTNRRYLAHGFTYLQASFGLATVLLARGESEQAQVVANSTLAYAWDRGDQSIMEEAKAFQAYMAARLGRKAEARRWAASYKRNRPLIPLIMFHATPIALAQILLNQGSPQSLVEADDWLRRLHSFASETHNARFMIEVLALQAMLHSMRGLEAAAFDAIEQAVLLAEPGGLVRVFVDLGPPLAGLLAKLARQGVAAGFVGKVLDAIPSPPAVSHRPQRGTQMMPPRPLTANAGLPMPLSRRELEVLELLAQRLTVKEVAERLIISELTAKRHTANIYLKLGVNRRRDALAAAEAGGLLT